MKLVQALLVITIVAVLIAGCATYRVNTYGNVDASEKSITVPAGGGGGGLLGELKNALMEAGWELAVYRGPDVTEGTTGEDTMLMEYDTFNTRYTLFYSYTPIGNGLYELAFIDNELGKEIFSASGQSGIPLELIVDNFMETIEELSETPS